MHAQRRAQLPLQPQRQHPSLDNIRQGAHHLQGQRRDHRRPHFYFSEISYLPAPISPLTLEMSYGVQTAPPPTATPQTPDERFLTLGFFLRPPIYVGQKPDTYLASSFPPTFRIELATPRTPIFFIARSLDCRSWLLWATIAVRTEARGGVEWCRV